jgi:RNA polymerase sigma-70 factor, ECF subfamily
VLYVRQFRTGAVKKDKLLIMQRSIVRSQTLDISHYPHGDQGLMDPSLTIRFSRPAASKQNEAMLTVPSVGSGIEAGATDEVLMAQVCQGGREALSVLFQRYSRLVRTISNRILRDSAEAEDLLQDVFLFIYRRCAIFESSKGSARSWIVQLTYHRAIDRRRYLQSRHFYTQVDLNEATDALDPRSLKTEADPLVAELVGNTTIQGLLGSLTEDQRNTLSLHFFEGHTFAEIAVKMDQPVGNIRNHYYRGLDKLRKQIFAGKLRGRNGCGRK